MDTPSGVIPGLILDVLYVPSLATTLLSVLRFTSRNHNVRFEGNNCFIITKPSGRCVAQTIKTPGGLYSLQALPTPGKEYANLACSSCHIDINLLHRRLGHLSHDNVKRLVNKGMVDGIESVGGHVDLCEACIHGKQNRHPFPSSNKKARHKLDLVHSDVCGPLPSSIGESPTSSHLLMTTLNMSGFTSCETKVMHLLLLRSLEFWLRTNLVVPSRLYGLTVEVNTHPMSSRHIYSILGLFMRRLPHIHQSKMAIQRLKTALLLNAYTPCFMTPISPRVSGQKLLRQQSISSTAPLPLIYQT